MDVFGGSVSIFLGLPIHSAQSNDRPPSIASPYSSASMTRMTWYSACVRR